MFSTSRSFLYSGILRRIPFRTYSSKVNVGSKFESLDQIKEYLNKPIWSMEEYLSSKDDATFEAPTKEMVNKLLKLSGLPSQNVDIGEIQNKLGKQLKFLKKLQDADIDAASEDITHARLVPRKIKPLTYKDLLAKISDQNQGKFEDEVSGTWNSTAEAESSKNGYFIVKKAHKDV